MSDAFSNPDADQGRVVGIGGVFFKSPDPQALKAWYQTRLGIEPSADGHVMFPWRDHNDPERLGTTSWSVFPQTTKYLDPSPAPFMINYRVANLNALIERLRSEGIAVEGPTEEPGFGWFAWVMDPDQNRIELWEPPNGL